ncbi:MAG TPA: hypothetical protein VNE62_03925 [Actinomycetota bacterium]|nr:hypothetical protein [Actinomycetota bacterium]
MAVHLSDSTVVPAEVVDVGDERADFFVAVMAPSSATWVAVVASAADGTELDRRDRREFRR